MSERKVVTTIGATAQIDVRRLPELPFVLHELSADGKFEDGTKFAFKRSVTDNSLYVEFGSEGNEVWEITLFDLLRGLQALRKSIP